MTFPILINPAYLTPSRRVPESLKNRHHLRQHFVHDRVGDALRKPK